MQFVLFYQSLVSDWNHLTAHFLRGIASELLGAGHSVRIFEPIEGWSLHNLREQGGDGVVKAFHSTYPQLRSSLYDPLTLDLDAALADADVVIAHEWTDPGFLRRLGRHRAERGHYSLLFHDAPHHPLRSLQRPQVLWALTLTHFDGVLASTERVRRVYEQHHWAQRAWVWREAVDTRLFHPQPTPAAASFDLIFIGDWGDADRATQLNEFLIDPMRTLGWRARCYGERYPTDAVRTLRAAGIDYGGWVPDFCLPAALATGRFTVHVPRTLGSAGLRCSSVIRVLQALACGIPVVSAPWDACEELFAPGLDLLIGTDGAQIQRHLTQLRNDRELARAVTAHGYRTVMGRHTCRHRAMELLSICGELRKAERKDELRRYGAGDLALPGNLPATPHVAAAHRPAPPRSHAPAAWS